MLESFDLLRTESPNGARYYANGRRISRRAFNDCKAWAARVESMVTRVAGLRTRNYATARLAPHMANLWESRYVS